MASVQIGLAPWIVYAGGALLWTLFMVQMLCTRRGRFQRALLHLQRDVANCCMSQRGGTVFLTEASCAWGDFVSDFAVALSSPFPHIALFVLMWVFIGVQVFPYMVLVFFVRGPGGWLLPPVGPMLEWRHLYAGLLAGPAWRLFADAATGAWACLTAASLAGWYPAGVRSGACLFFARLGTIVLLGLGGICGFSLALVLGIAYWAVFLVLAVLTSVSWLTSWIVLISLIAVLRIVLWAFGFLLYVTKLLSFPDIPLTQLFFHLWNGEDSGHAHLCDIDSNDDVGVFEMSYQNVNLFTLHFSYVAELFLESIAQLVIQILVASFSGWTVSTIVSVTFSSVMILLYSCRYLYWFAIKPCIDKKPFRMQLIEMHKFYYDFEREDSDDDMVE